MSRVRIIIATTTAPVTVQRITEEDAEVNSVVCLAGKAMALPISPAYDAFVRDPTGVIQRHFGHPAFRVDVSEKIDEGYSWQLGLFAAHALQNANQLAGQKDEPEHTVITTGEVDRDLNVHGVSGNEEKTKVLRAEIETLIGRAHKVTIAIPKENSDHWNAAFSDLINRSPGFVEVLAIETVDQLLNHLGIALPDRQAPVSEAPVEKVKERKSPLMIAALLLLIGATAVAGGVSYSPQIKTLSAKVTKTVRDLVSPPEIIAVKPEPTPGPVAKPVPNPVVKKPEVTAVSTKKDPEPARLQVPTPPRKPAEIPEPVKATIPPASEKDVLVATKRPSNVPQPVRIQLSELRTPGEYNCTQFRKLGIKAIPQPENNRGLIRMGGPGIARLCTIEIAVTSAKDNSFLFGRYQRWTQGRPSDTVPDKVIDLGPRQNTVSWSVDIPNKLERSAVFQVLILSSSDKFKVPEKLLRRLSDVRSGSDRMKRIQKRLKKQGITLTTKRFRVVPERDRRRPPPPRNENVSGRLPPPPPIN